jgi:hypothetical protein
LIYYHFYFIFRCTYIQVSKCLFYFLPRYCSWSISRIFYLKLFFLNFYNETRF